MAVLEMRHPPQPDISKIPTPPHQATALFVNIFLPLVATIAVGLRVYTRITMRQLAIDDYLIILALGFSVAMIAPFHFYIKLNYFGWHEVDVPPFDTTPGLWWFYVGQILYNPVLALVKASILCFLLRLGGHKRGVRYFIYGLLTFNGLQAVAVFFVAVFQCIPIAANWDPAVAATAKCIDPVFHIITSSITIVTDVLVVVIPFWIFLGLKLPLAARLAVIGIFASGVGVTAVSIVRARNLYTLFYAPPDPTADHFYDIGIVLNVIEINLAIIAAALPVLRPLMRKWFPNLFGGSSDKYPTGQYINPRSKSGAGKGTSRAQNSALGYGHGDGIGLKNMSRHERSQHTEVRSVSPSASEEEIMTSNGILRTTDVRIHYENDRTFKSDLRSSFDLKTPSHAL